MVRGIAFTSNDRVETGGIQFGNDWPGLFIRGDDCIFLKMSLECLINDPDENDVVKIVCHNFLMGLIEEINKNVLIQPKNA